jgi:C-terminal processing protease CtpA/Prc
MRIGFGLVSLLVVLGIMLFIFRYIEAPQIEVGQQAQQQGEQIAGRDANGTPVYKTYKGEAFLRGNQFAGITITDLTPGGAMETAYGLKVGDVVVQIGGNDVQTYGDFDSAKGQLDQAYQSNATLLVDRDGNKLTLTPQGPLQKMIPGP